MKTFLLVLTVVLSACNSNKSTSELFLVNGKAIRGYDAVAFHSQQKAVKGNDSYTYNWKGADWLFVNQENADSFKANPEKYAPQYGGYCAYGTAEGHKAPTDIDTWTVYNKKLYFNYNREVQQLWKKDQEALINKADKLWPTVKDDEF